MLRSLAVALLITFPALADMTLRYTMEVKPGPSMPPQAVDQMKSALGTMMDKGIIYCFKENGASYTKFGPTIQIFDPTTRMNITLLVEKKVYSQGEAGKQDAMNSDAMAQLKKMTDNGGFKVTTESSGRTRTIGGFEAEEKLITMEMSLQGSVPPDQAAQMPPSMKMKMSMWYPTANENNTKPILKKYRELAQMGMLANNPMEQIGKMFAGSPQAAAELQNLTQDSMRGGVMLGLEYSMIMPGMAKRMAAMLGRKPEEVDDNEPLMTMVLSLKEFSEGEVQEDLFKIPEGFKEVKMDEMSKLMLEVYQPKKPDQQKPSDDEKKDEKKQ